MQRLLKIVNGQQTGWSASVVRGCLWLLSKPYGVVIAIRNWLYKRQWRQVHKAEIPVISIGNLTVGGTGKTPTVAMLARWFRDQNIRVCIISRGFGADDDGRNDEAKELELSLPDVPHLQNPDRVAAITTAREELESQVALLDDGFQHRRLHRDLDIVLLDALEPFGYGHLLPRGLLREPLTSLRRADVVLIARADQVTEQSLATIRSRVQRYAPSAAWVESEHSPQRLRNSSGATESLELIDGKRILAFCGIGNPKGFFQTVKSLGGQLVHTETFPDHHQFSADDIQAIRETLDELNDVDLVLCTGKDLVKLSVDSFGEKPLWCVDIELSIRFGHEALLDRLNEILPAIPPDPNLEFAGEDSTR
jgi:tetraacyldisaccharide 4'-kinase